MKEDDDSLITNLTVKAPCKFPIHELLKILANATDILLHTFDYDGHGYELLYYALEASKKVEFKLLPNIKNLSIIEIDCPDCNDGYMRDKNWKPGDSGHYEWTCSTCNGESRIKVAMNNWVSIKNDKPKEGQRVLGCAKWEKDYFIGYWNSEENYLTEYKELGSGFIFAITHWQLLPELPEEKQ
jgi:hypothetical protein